MDAAAVEAVDLKTSAGQIGVLEAATKALAAGKIGGATATALAQLVRVAAGIAAGDQEKAIRELEQRMAHLVHPRVQSGR
jgi:F0F1-type ATP synthase epsilon subunit